MTLNEALNYLKENEVPYVSPNGSTSEGTLSDGTKYVIMYDVFIDDDDVNNQEDAIYFEIHKNISLNVNKQFIQACYNAKIDADFIYEEDNLTTYEVYPGNAISIKDVDLKEFGKQLANIFDSVS